MVLLRTRAGEIRRYGGGGRRDAVRASSGAGGLGGSGEGLWFRRTTLRERGRCEKRERARLWEKGGSPSGFIERGGERENRRGGTADINAINGVSSRKKKWGREKRKRRH
jgi:hypothetical protein